MKDPFKDELSEDLLNYKDNVEHDIYEADFVNVLLEDDALSFEEAAFMSGYSNLS